MTAACAQLVAVHPASASDELQPELNTVLFGSLDAGRTGYASAGFKRTWQGSLDRSGLVTLATVGYGGSPERVDAHGEENAFRHKASASALLGYQWISGPVVMAGYPGPSSITSAIPTPPGKPHARALGFERTASSGLIRRRRRS